MNLRTRIGQLEKRMQTTTIPIQVGIYQVRNGEKLYQLAGTAERLTEAEYQERCKGRSRILLLDNGRDRSRV